MKQQIQNFMSKFGKPRVFDSRAFQSGIVGIIITCLIYYVPELEPYREELPEIIKWVTIALIARFTYSNNDGGGDVPE
jgi:hypothetical protein